jgi:RNA polymerase sigma-70 factor (ECF subfamily)
VYGPLVYGWCRQRRLQPADVEDVVQEVFRVVLLRIPDFRKGPTGGTFRGWLWTITRNKIADYWRRYAAQPQPAGGSEARVRLEDLPEDKPEDAETSARELAGIYRRALALVRTEFEEKTWQAFWLVVCENRRPADVAANLELSLNAVYLAKSRVLRAVREALGEVAED